MTREAGRDVLGKDELGQQQLRILNSIGAAVIAVDRRDRIIFWNASAAEMLGWEWNEALGKDLASLVGRPAAASLPAADTSWDGELAVPHRRGWSVPIRVSVNPLRSGHSHTVGRVLVAIGIAGELAVRRALEASERRFRALVAHASDGIAVLDDTGLISYASASLCALLDVTEAEVLGKPGLSYMAPAEGARLRESVVGANGVAVGPIEMRLRRSDGTMLEFEGFRSDLRHDPDVRGIVWNLRDMTPARRAQVLLEQSEERLRALAEASSDITGIVDASGVVTYVSPAIERVLGYAAEDVLGRPIGELGAVHRDDVRRARREFAGSGRWKNLDPFRRIRVRIRRRDGEWRWFSVQFRDLSDNPGIGGIVINLRDVTSQHLSDVALAASELRHRTIIETATEGIWIHDLDGRPTFANPRMAELLGMAVEQVLETRLEDVVRDEDLPSVRAHLAKRRAGVSERYELTVMTTSGQPVDVLISASPLRDANGDIVGSLKMVTDITDRKRMERENARLALTDSLTGVANRALLMDRLEQSLARAVRTGGEAAVLFLDLDGFKRVNDSLGHAAGDALLRHVATTIVDAVDVDGTVARVGGDEFVVLLDEEVTAHHATAVAERILAALQAPVLVDGTALIPNASIGIALTPAPTGEQLLHNADAAMYRAKRGGGSRYELFDAASQAPALAKLELERDMRVGWSRGQFAVHYQPVVLLDGTITGFEALMRWEHPVRGWVPPSEFIPLAEETGLISDLGAFVLRQACGDLARWRRLPGMEDLNVAVNLSARQIARPELVREVEGIVRSAGLDPGALCLEITESALMEDVAAATRSLEAIRALGVTLAIDDFGTGYSSLLYLRRFPVTILKLDRFFVAGLATNAQDPAIVRAIVDLAHSLDLVAVAEGVEQRAQLDALRGLGCDLAQGFFWSRPVPASDIEELLRRGRMLDGGEPEETVSAAPLVSDVRLRETARDPSLDARVPTVVIVDDSPSERRLLQSYLADSGRFRVVGEAADGHTGITLAGRTQPDFVLLDISMPGMDGLEALPHVLCASPRTKVVMISGYLSAGLRTHAVAAGATAVLEKGCSLGSIAAELWSVATATATTGDRTPVGIWSDDLSDRPLAGATVGADA